MGASKPALAQSGMIGGEVVVGRCPRCAYHNRPIAVWCGWCGTPLRGSVPPRFGARTAKGRHPENQDKALIRTLQGSQRRAYTLCCVADGVGGGPAGAHASRWAVAVAHASLAAQLAIGEPADGAGWRALLRLAVISANHELHQQATANAALHGMGTTLTAAVIVNNHVHLGHVGDTRLYRVDAEGSLHRATTDHTLAERLSACMLGADDEVIAEGRQILYRVLGLFSAIEVDTASFELGPNERVLLCSDGLTRALTEQLITGLLAAAADPQYACDTLVARAVARCDDDITVILAEPGTAMW